jgi:hypothetical protein
MSGFLYAIRRVVGWKVEMMHIAMISIMAVITGIRKLLLLK